MLHLEGRRSQQFSTSFNSKFSFLFLESHEWDGMSLSRLWLSILQYSIFSSLTSYEGLR